MTKIIGVVHDGVGQAKSFTQFDWVLQQVRAKLGFEPYPGTLNLHIADAAQLALWRARARIVIEPATGFCAAHCLRVTINERIAGAWIIPDVPGYPNDVVEVIAPVSLRDTLALKTGDAVSIEFLE